MITVASECSFRGRGCGYGVVGRANRCPSSPQPAIRWNDVYKPYNWYQTTCWSLGRSEAAVPAQIYSHQRRLCAQRL